MVIGGEKAEIEWGAGESGRDRVGREVENDKRKEEK